MGVTIEVYVGKDSLDYIETISKLRIEIFKEYPYLYKGDLAYENNYMQGYTQDKRAMIVIAKVDGVLAGVSTGIPLISDSEIVADAKKCFSQQDVEIGDYYYYGEVIVLPEFRGMSLTTKLYEAQNELVKSWGYKHVCILTVVREPDHPLKPNNYVSKDKMWEHLGFFRRKLTVDYHWPTIQPDKSVQNVNNTLEFWAKDLDVLEPGEVANEDGDDNISMKLII